MKKSLINMFQKYLVATILIVNVFFSFGQSKNYQEIKAEKIEKGSVFTKIINKELPAKVIYEDDDVIAFLPLRLQARVHVLIIPKKEIHTVNDITENDALVLGKLFLVAKKIAKEQGIAKTGYRLTMNVNEDAGQSVFHLHLHLLGGENLGPMMKK
ncbi:histidine triad nucleotide-binding protein [Tenacibaculum halocynthiae]|uniref:histidine triad nucleotide-binding protein n=1 Tax=Tenacibaculum halocynthiae TaxID=1254437 RepID=UPI003D65C63F